MREDGERIGLGARGPRLGRTPCGGVDDGRHRDPDRDEDRDRHDVLRLGDRQRVERRREEVVEHQRARERRHDGGRETTDQGRRHHDDHQRHRLDGQAVEVRGQVEQAAHERGHDEPEGEAGDPATAPEVVDGRSSRGPADVVVGDDVDVDVARPADHALADTRAQQGGDTAAAAGADDDLGGVLGSGEGEDRVGRVVAHDRVEGAAQLLRLGLQLRQAVGRDPGEPVLPRDVERLPLPAGAAGGDPGCPPHQRGGLRSAADGYDDAFTRGPRGVDLVLVAVALEPLVDPVGQPQQGQLAQRGEVALAEVARQRGVDPVGGVDVAVGHPAPQRLRAHVHQLDLVRRTDHVVRDRLALQDAGDLPGHVVERLQVLDVDGGDDLDAGVEQGLDVLPPLLVPATGHVGVGELIDQHHVRVTRQDGVEVHLLLHRAPVGDLRPRDELQALQLALGPRPTVGLDVADDEVGAPLDATVALVEHGVRLAHPRSGAEVDAQPSTLATTVHALSLHPRRRPPRRG